MSNEPTVRGGSNDIRAWGRKVRQSSLVVMILIVILGIAAALYAAFVEHIGYF